jgi:DNA-binding transcriptional LysR family regulator
MDRLDELAVFVAIIDHGGLAAAARRLRRSPPAVTRALSSLEERLGVRLIERTTRRFAPTEAGRALAARARVLLGDYDDAVNGTSGAPVHGLLRVTAPLQFGRRHVAGLIAGFLDTYADMRVELVLNDRYLDLIDESIDVAVRIGAMADSSLRVTKVGDVRLVLVASPAYLARRGVPQKPTDLRAHEAIVGTTRGMALEWRFGSAKKTTTVHLTPRFLVNEIESQLFAARAGRGIARVLSYQVAEDIAAGSLVRVLRDYEPPALPVQLVAPGGSYMPPKTRAFLDYATAALRQLPVIHE